MTTQANQPRAEFQVQVFEYVFERDPTWTGDVETFLQGNEELDSDDVRRIRALCPGQVRVFDMGAGGLWKIRRVG